MNVPIPGVGMSLYSRGVRGWEPTLEFESQTAFNLFRAISQDELIRQGIGKMDQKQKFTFFISNSGGENGNPKRLADLLDRIAEKIDNQGQDKELAKRIRFAAYVNFANSKIAPVPAVKHLRGHVGAIGLDMHSLLPLREERRQFDDPREIIEFPEACEAAVDGGFNGFVTVRYLVPSRKNAAAKEEFDYNPIRTAVAEVSRLSENLAAKAPPPDIK